MLRISALALALVSCAVTVISVRSHQTPPSAKDFVVLNDDGYGTSDCLTKETACGKIVADAWCESKGYAKSVAYRPAEAGDVTHSTTAPKSALVDSFVISCTQ